MMEDLTKKLVSNGLRTLLEHHRDDIAKHARDLRKHSQRGRKLAETLDELLNRLSAPKDTR